MGVRKFWPVAILLLVGFLRLVWRADDERPAFVFEVTASALESHAMQLYFQRDPAAGLSEASSVTVALQSADQRTYQFRLEAGVYRALRFDPMRRGGTIRLSQARIVDARTGRERCSLPVSTWTMGQNIRHMSLDDDVLAIDVADDKSDPTVTIPLPETPLTLEHGIAGRVVATLIAILVTVGVMVGAPRLARLAGGTIMNPLRTVERAIQRVIPAEILPVDLLAIGFLGALFLCCATGAALGLHGSSSSIRGEAGVPPGHWEPLYGKPKNIRGDEWEIHTPVILFQAHRADPLAIDSIIGPHKSILIGNAPVRHWSTLFRPQFFPFFALPTTQAFAAYWQCKNLLLVSGTFLLFLLLTRSSGLAVFGALWFLLSSYTQWAFSWPALLPEMIGLVCLAVVTACLVFVVPSRRVAGCLGLVLVLATVNLVLCSYPPFQIPLAWAGFGLWIAWMLQLRPTSNLRWTQGLVSLGAAVVVTAAVVALFFREIWPVVEITAHTIYPGKRSMPGGTVSWEQLVSSFIGPLQSETRCPPQFGNICEASGYFWFGVVSLTLAAPVFRASAEIYGRRLYFVLFVPLLLLASWSVFPVPAGVGRLFLLDQVHSSRVLPALGLLNSAITVLFLGLISKTRPITSIKNGLRQRWLILVSATVAFSLLFWMMNRSLGDFFAWSHLVVGALLAGITTWALAHGWTPLFATVVLTPLLWANLLINPIDRGFAVFTTTPLRKFIDTHPCQDARWLVVSESATAAQYCTALGLEVINAFNFVPYLDRWHTLDPHGKQAGYYNGSGITIVRAMPAGSGSHFEPVEGGQFAPPMLRRWHVDPADQRLRAIGVRYFAVQGEANLLHFPADQFERLTDFPVDGFTLFRSQE